MRTEIDPQLLETDMKLSRLTTPLLIVLLVLALLTTLFFLGNGLVRSFSGEPQLWETHVRYTWREKTGPRQCVVAIRGKPAVPCTQFTKEQLNEMRLQWEKPSEDVMDGKFR